MCLGEKSLLGMGEESTTETTGIDGSEKKV